jgi:hypothetical protein
MKGRPLYCVMKYGITGSYSGPEVRLEEMWWSHASASAQQGSAAAPASSWHIETAKFLSALVKLDTSPNHTASESKQKSLHKICRH